LNLNQIWNFCRAAILPLSFRPLKLDLLINVHTTTSPCKRTEQCAEHSVGRCTVIMYCICTDESSWTVARYFISEQHPSWRAGVSESNWQWQVLTLSDRYCQCVWHRQVLTLSDRYWQCVWHWQVLTVCQLPTALSPVNVSVCCLKLVCVYSAVINLLPQITSCWCFAEAYLVSCFCVRVAVLLALGWQCHWCGVIVYIMA